MKDILNLVQWPAMAVTVAAAWLVASQSKTKRSIGFWVFIVSNALWIIWGWHDHAYALIFLQLCLAGMNIRGIFKNDPGILRGTNLSVDNDGDARLHG
jgi:hypothetical protein